MGLLPTRDAPPGFQALADATPALIWVDAAGRAARWSTGPGWSSPAPGPTTTSATAGRPASTPPTRERCAAVRTAAIAAGEPFELEYRLRRADGRYRWVLDRGAPLGDGSYVGGCLDIDDRTRAGAPAAARRHRRGHGHRDDGGRRAAQVLVRTLVDEGLVDLARLVDIAPGTPRTVAVAAARPEDDARPAGGWTRRAGSTRASSWRACAADHVDDAYLAGISTATSGSARPRRRSARTRRRSCRCGRAAGWWACSSPGAWATRPRSRTDDAALLGEIGQRAAIALDNAALLAAEQATTRRLELLQRATAALSAAPSPAPVAAHRGPAARASCSAPTRWRCGSAATASLRAARQRGLPDRRGVGAVADRRAHAVHRHRPRRRAALHREPRRGPPRLPGDLGDVPGYPRLLASAAAGRRTTGSAPSPSASPAGDAARRRPRASRSRSPTSARTPCNARACSPPSRSRGAPRRGSRTSCRRCRARPPPRRSPP